MNNMTAEEIANVGEEVPNRNQNNADGVWSPQSGSEISTDRSSKRSVSYKVNNFEHRYSSYGI